MKKDYISLMLLNYGGKEPFENKTINLINFGSESKKKKEDKKIKK